MSSSNEALEKEKLQAKGSFLFKSEKKRLVLVKDSQNGTYGVIVQNLITDSISKIMFASKSMLNAALSFARCIEVYATSELTQ